MSGLRQLEQFPEQSILESGIYQMPTILPRRELFSQLMLKDYGFFTVGIDVSVKLETPQYLWDSPRLPSVNFARIELRWAEENVSTYFSSTE
jgi:hypothetical protein